MTEHQETEGIDEPIVELIDIASVEDSLGNADFNIVKEKFVLAKHILLYIFLIISSLTLVRLFVDYKNPEAIKEMFNTIFQSSIPIASLIIGYYFGSKES